ncbi:26S proteasome regulatory subunit [Venturia nashicola]|nr:26S proteasome regulatory subunit [Venturia nashicola]
MKLTIALLVASLASYVSADAYELCCCTKTDESSGYWGCHPDPTQAVVDAAGGYFTMGDHFWLHINGAPIESSYYIYNNEGTHGKIGAKEMAGWCKKYGAGQKCWNPGNKSAFNYKGEKTVPDITKG